MAMGCLDVVLSDVECMCAVGDEEYKATSRLLRSVYPQLFAKGLCNALHQTVDGWVDTDLNGERD